MFFRSWLQHRIISTLAVSCAIIASARAANVTPKVKVNFDGGLNGTTYTLGAGELDTTGTFQANGSATITAGIADIPGDLDETSGFFFDKTSLGDLTTQNWVGETVMILDVPAPEQPQLGGQVWNHFIDVQGDLFIRVNNGVTEFGYWDGSSEPRITIPDLSIEQYSHVALTWDAGTNTLEAFVNGATQSTVTTSLPFEVLERVLVGYGFFARFLNRAIDGKLDSVAFSTFTGAFDPAADFQLALPASALLGDYNDNGVVDAADYVLWRNGGPLLNEAHNPGTLTQEDYNEWRARFGNTSGAGLSVSSTLTAVPEPVSLLVATVAVVLVIAGSRRLSLFR